MPAGTPTGGLKPKDLIGMPWMLAFALRADGWWLRSEIIWAKPNPMPESVTDRPTKAHEQIFLFAKAARYYYDADAIREPHSREWAVETVGPKYMTAQDGRNDGGKREGNFQHPAGRNARSVWTISTAPFSEAHFATFPPELPRRCILAGTSERGVCGACGAPWRRVVERESVLDPRPMTTGAAKKAALGDMARTTPQGRTCGTVDVTTTGWAPTCAHGGEPAPKKQDGHGRRHAGFNARWDATEAAGITKTTTGWDPECSHALDPVPATVLDPFAGSGTTLMVAVRHGRSAIGIELNPEYAAMARRRILADHGAVEPTNGHTPEGRGRGTQGRLAL